MANKKKKASSPPSAVRGYGRRQNSRSPVRPIDFDIDKYDNVESNFCCVFPGFPELTMAFDTSLIQAKKFVAGTDTIAVHNAARQAIYDILVTGIRRVVPLDAETESAIMDIVQAAYSPTSLHKDTFAFTHLRANKEHFTFTVVAKYLSHCNDPKCDTIVCIAPEIVTNMIFSLTESTLHDRPDDEFFSKHRQVLSPAIRGAFDIYDTLRAGQETPLKKFSDSLCIGMDGNWNSSIALYMATEPEAYRIPDDLDDGTGNQRRTDPPDQSQLPGGSGPNQPRGDSAQDDGNARDDNGPNQVSQDPESPPDSTSDSGPSDAGADIGNDPPPSGTDRDHSTISAPPDDSDSNRDDVPSRPTQSSPDSDVTNRPSDSGLDSRRQTRSTRGSDVTNRPSSSGPDSTRPGSNSSRNSNRRSPNNTRQRSSATAQRTYATVLRPSTPTTVPNLGGNIMGDSDDIDDSIVAHAGGLHPISEWGHNHSLNVSSIQFAGSTTTNSIASSTNGNNGHSSPASAAPAAAAAAVAPAARYTPRQIYDLVNRIPTVSFRDILNYLTPTGRKRAPAARSAGLSTPRTGNHGVPAPAPAPIPAPVPAPAPPMVPPLSPMVPLADPPGIPSGTVPAPPPLPAVPVPAPGPIPAHHPLPYVPGPVPATIPISTAPGLAHPAAAAGSAPSPSPGPAPAPTPAPSLYAAASPHASSGDPSREPPSRGPPFRPYRGPGGYGAPPPPPPGGFPPSSGPDDDSDEYLDGCDWREHRIDPRTIDTAMVRTVHRGIDTIRPWRFPRPETGSTLNFPVRHRVHVCSRDSYLRSIASPGLEPASIKAFLYGFPHLPSDSHQCDIYDFLTHVVRYCQGYGVYVPPMHTMVHANHAGLWYEFLPDHCIHQWDFYDQALHQGLTGKTANLSYSDLTKEFLREFSGYQIIWLLAAAAGHPHLNIDTVPTTMPIQKSDTSFLSYRQAWNHYLHVQFTRGINYSDRYFLECFSDNLHSAFNSTLKPAMLRAGRDIPLDRPVPIHFTPERIVQYLASCARHIGIHNLSATMTPREFLTSRGSKKSASLRQIVEAPDFVDVRSLDIPEDLYLKVCSLVASSTTRSCDLCANSSHLVASCPLLHKVISDPVKARRVLDTIDRSTRGGPQNSSASRNPPRSGSSGRNGSSSGRSHSSNGRSANIRQITDDDTDEEALVASLTDDDEGLTDDSKSDFP